MDTPAAQSAMDEDLEMENFIKEESSRPLLETFEEVVIQPCPDSPKEQREEKQQVNEETLSCSSAEVNENARETALQAFTDYFDDAPLVSQRKEVQKPKTEGLTKEEVITAEKADDNVERQKDLKREDEDRLTLQDRLNFEKEMDEILKAGDLDDINDWVTPQKLTKCATNCLEKSLEVSHKLNSLANAKGPDADDLSTLGTSVEDFAVQLLEPLKSDDLKRAIFEEEDFDRVTDKAVQYRQKKFVSHPVVYNILMRQRWTGYFYQLRYSKNIFKWFLLNFWTFFDVFLFPLVHILLWVIHLIIEFAKKRQELRVVFLFNASWKKADETFMKTTAQFIMDKTRNSDKIQYATITRDCKGPIVTEFTSSENAIKKMPEVKDVQHPTREVNKNKDVKEFRNCLKQAEHLFQGTEKGSKKVLVVMTDDKLGLLKSIKQEQNQAELLECIKQEQNQAELLKSIKQEQNQAELLKSIKQEQNVNVISVGFGLEPEIKELKTIATSDENVVLIFEFNEESNTQAKKSNVLQCIRGKDIYDRYVQYFTTPYFIFFRDTLSYLALLGLHFVMCLQPSTIHFTAVEWIISVFFLGRFMMEISQFVMENKSDWTDKNDLSQQDQESKQKPKDAEKETEKSTPAKPQEEKQDQHDKKYTKTQKLKKLWKAMSNYLDDWWNILDIVTLIVFLVIVGLRIFISSQHSSISKNRLLAVAGYLYGLNAMLLTLRVFGHIMESKKSTGSIQIALFQIIGAVIAIFGQFLAATVAFSLAITKIYVAEVSYNSGKNAASSGLCGNQNGLNCWWSFTRYLTWSLLGIAELTPLESSDDTSDVLAKILYGLFLIMGVVMLMNMMIALLSNTYQHVEDNAFYEWSYKKATTIRTYNKYHPVPVPFNIISMSFILFRHIYRTINCTRCKNKTKTDAPETDKTEKKGTRKEKKLLFDSLVEDLQAEYFAMYGYAFPMADDDKMDRVLKETEGCHQLIGHIARRAFRYDQGERKQLESHGHPANWDTRGIDVVGQRLVHVSCQCTTCISQGEIRHHGAKYLNPLSKEYPEFEVLIQESGERRFVAIGVVTKNYEIHNFPGWDGNTAGYHIDDGKIFDRAHSKLGKEGEDAMAKRGDLIGCKILYDEQKDNKLPVSFSLNGRVVGKANLSYTVNQKESILPHADVHADVDVPLHPLVASAVPSVPSSSVPSVTQIPLVDFYPYVGIGCEGISLLFRMCPKDSLPLADVDEKPKTISEQLQIIIERQTELERKVDLLLKDH